MQKQSLASTNLSRGLRYAAEFLITSIAGQAVFAMSWNSAFRVYWAKLGTAASEVVRPKGSAVDVFALWLLVAVIIVVPGWSLYKAITHLSSRRKAGTPSTAASGFIPARLHLAGSLLVYLLIALGMSTSSWTCLVLAVLISVVLGVDLGRLVDGPTRQKLAFVVVGLILACPRLVASVASPHVSANGVGGFSGDLFPADLPAPLHLRGGPTEAPVAPLGRTILGAVVVVDMCAANQRAFEVDQDRLVRPTQLRSCPMPSP